MRLHLDLRRHNPETINYSKKCKLTKKLKIVELINYSIQLSTVAPGSWPELHLLERYSLSMKAMDCIVAFFCPSLGRPATGTDHFFFFQTTGALDIILSSFPSFDFSAFLSTNN